MSHFFYGLLTLFFVAQIGLAHAVIHVEGEERLTATADLHSVKDLPVDFRQDILREAARWTDYSDQGYDQLKETGLSRLSPETTTGRYGLTSDEIFSINTYTNFMSTAVNRALNNSDKETTVFFQPYITLLKSALTKLPDYAGETIRIVEFPPDVLAQHQRGRIVTYHGFTSSSIGGTYGKWSRNTRLVIAAKHGKHIEDYAADPEDREVIFAPDTQFKVKDRSIIVGPEKQKVTLIHLEEI